MVVADIVGLEKRFELVGFLDSINPIRAGTSFLDRPVYGGTDKLPWLRKRGIRHVLMAIGDNETRLLLGKDAVKAGFSLARAIHPGAIVASDVVIGEGSVVAGGAVINPGCRLGKLAIVNTGATVDHECIVEDGAHIGPGAHLAGRVSVRRAAWVGIGAAVIDRISIGAGAMVGAGSVVVRDVSAGATVFGVPARVRRASKSHA
jgi:acetyltransferase EpsM